MFESGFGANKWTPIKTKVNVLFVKLHVTCFLSMRKTVFSYAIHFTNILIGPRKEFHNTPTGSFLLVGLGFDKLLMY